MQGNPLLKWLLIALALLVVFVGFKLLPEKRETVSSGAVSQLTPEEMKALGIEGDTPRDTVATLVAQVRQLRGELRGTLSDSKEQKAENERLRAREGTIDQRIRSAWRANATSCNRNATRSRASAGRRRNCSRIYNGAWISSVRNVPPAPPPICR
jgi:hypothetical protein